MTLRASAIAAPVASVALAAPAASGGAAPVAPVGSTSLGDLFTAFFRRFETLVLNKTPTASPVQTSQAVTGILTGTLNAADAEGDPLKYSVSQPALHGTAVVNADGTYSYVPNADFAASGATDTFTVTISEANAGSHVHGPADLINRLIRFFSLGLIKTPDASIVQDVVTVHASVVTATIPVGKFPHDPSLSPAGDYVYVANDLDGSVSVINTATNTVIKTITVGGFLGDVAVSPDGSFAYVTSSSFDTLYRVNTQFNFIIGSTALAGSIPGEVAFDPSGAYAYVIRESNGSVAVVKTSNGTVVTTIAGAAQSGPTDVAVRADGKRIYVSNDFANTVSVIDTDPLDVGYNTVVASIALERPNGVAVSPDGTRLYVSREFSGAVIGNTVWVIDTATNSVIDTVVVGAKPSALAVSPDGTRVYVANSGGDDTVSVIDTATDTVIATIPVGSIPAGVAVSPDGRRVYVTNYFDDSVSVITV
jgi:YVTN family beta-propeller protein